MCVLCRDTHIHIHIPIPIHTYIYPYPYPNPYTHTYTIPIPIHTYIYTYPYTHTCITFSYSILKLEPMTVIGNARIRIPESLRPFATPQLVNYQHN